MHKPVGRCLEKWLLLISGAWTLSAGRWGQRQGTCPSSPSAWACGIWSATCTRQMSTWTMRTSRTGWEPWRTGRISSRRRWASQAHGCSAVFWEKQSWWDILWLWELCSLEQQGAAGLKGAGLWRACSSCPVPQCLGNWSGSWQSTQPFPVSSRRLSATWSMCRTVFASG